MLVVQSPSRMTPPAFDLTRELVAYWKFDEASGNASDEVGSNDLTNVGTMPYTTGIIGNAAQFDGTAKYLSLTPGADMKVFGAGFSISFWVYSTSTSTGYIVAGINGNSAAFLRQNSGGSPAWVYFTVNGLTAGIAGGSVFAQNAWTHVVAVYDPGQFGDSRARVYKNGALHMEDNFPGQVSPNTFASGSTALTIGSNGGATNFTGLLDELGIWSRPLSPQEVQALYGEGTPPAHPFTVADSSTILVDDVFDDTNGTALTAHTITPINVDTLSWTAITGSSFVITGNELNQDATSGEQVYALDSGENDITITYTGNIGVNPTYRAIAIFFRLQDQNNYLWWHIKHTGECHILERVAGSYTTLSALDVAGWSGDSLDHTFVLKLNGDRVRAYIDGSKKIDGVTTRFSGTTKYGLGQSGPGSASQGAVCKRFQVRTGDQFPPYPLSH